MTIEWHVPEEENTPFPPITDEYRPPRRLPPWTWLLLLLLVVVATGGGFFGGRVWRAKLNEEKLRTELTNVVVAESQAQSFGLQEEFNRFAASETDTWWRDNYALLFDPKTNTIPTWATAYPTSGTWHPPTLRPEITAILLNDTGTRADIDVTWRGHTTVVEHRTYVVESGAWRRTQGVPIDTTISQQSRSDHFVIQGSKQNLATLDEGTALLIPLEQLHDHMVATWPSPYIQASTVTTLTIQSRELQTLFIRSIPRDITLNATGVGLADPNLPYSAEKQQLVLAGTLSAIYSLNPLLSTRALYTGTSGNDGSTQTFLFNVLAQAEAQQVLLTPEEQTALRTLWHEQLEGEWFSPFESPNTPERVYHPGHQQIYFRWLLSTRLLLDQLYVEYGVTPGNLVTLIHNDPHRSLKTYIATLTGLPPEDVETHIRDYATSTP